MRRVNSTLLHSQDGASGCFGPPLPWQQRPPPPPKKNNHKRIGNVPLLPLRLLPNNSQERARKVSHRHKKCGMMNFDEMFDIIISEETRT